MERCQQDGCINLGTKYCGVCGESRYCSIKCQKGDWQLHRIWCNKMPTELIPVSEFRNIQAKVEKSLKAYSDKGNFHKSGPAMEKLLTFLEYQSGTKIPGKPHRIRDNSRVDIRCLITLRLSLGDLYCSTQNYEKALAHTLEAHEMLMTRTTECQDDEDLLRYRAESILSEAYFRAFDNSKAQHSAEIAVEIARRLSVVEYLYLSLIALARIMRLQSDDKKALALSQEAYEVVSEVHGPEHHYVQDAAEALIENLFSNGEISLAEDFARINYETLMNGTNSESLLSAAAMLQLVNLWAVKPTNPTEDPEIGEEAERVIDRAIEIVMRLYARDSNDLVTYLKTKNRVSMKKCRLTNQTRIDLEIVLRNTLRLLGILNDLTCSSLSCLGEYYFRMEPFDGHVEFETATMLFDWFRCLRNMQSPIVRSDDIDENFQKSAILFKECIIEFLDTGFSASTHKKSKEATATYKIWERTIMSTHRIRFEPSCL